MTGMTSRLSIPKPVYNDGLIMIVSSCGEVSKISHESQIQKKMAMQMETKRTKED